MRVQVDHEINCRLWKNPIIIVGIYFSNHSMGRLFFLVDLTFREMCCSGGNNASKDLLVIPFPAFFLRKVQSCRFAVKMVGKSSRFLLHIMIEG